MPDFADAEARHWEDAELLLGQSRWANADHLYGLAAECGLKAVLSALGPPPEQDSGAPKDHKVHVDKLWPKFILTAAGSPRAGYAALLPSPSPFCAWSVHHRYEPQARFSEAAVRGFRAGALAVRALMAQARLDGVL